MSANGSNPHSLPQQNSFSNSPADLGGCVAPFSQNQNRIIHFPEGTELSQQHNSDTHITMVRAQIPMRYAAHGGYFPNPQPFYPQGYPYSQAHPSMQSQPQQPVPPLNTFYGGPLMAPPQSQPVMSNGPIMLPSVSGAPIGASPVMASPAQMPAAMPQPQRANTQPRKVLSIVDPATKEIINKQELEGVQHASESSTAGSEVPEERAKVDLKSKGRNEVDDGKSAAEVQHRFQDAICSMAFDKPPQSTTVNQSATETDGSAKLRASSVPKNDSPTRPADDEEIALQNAVKEKLTLAASKSASSPPESQTPTISIESPAENGERETPKENEGKFVAATRSTADTPTDECNGKEEGGSLVNGTSPPAKEPLDVKVKRYEDEFSKLMTESKDVDLDACVYSTQFLHLMRKIVKDLGHVQCPKSDAELKDIGIDRAGMPAIVPSIKKYDNSNNKGTFFPSFMQSVNNQPRMNQRPNNYVGRSSDNKLRPKKAITSRSSIDRLARGSLLQEHSLPRKSANAWRPSRETRPADDAEAETLKYEKLRKEIRGLLNKITPSTYEDLTEEFIAKKCHDDPKLMNIVIDLIFGKAVEEPHFCALYSDLCKRQVDTEYKIAQEQKGGQTAKEGNVTFCHSIITKCQSTFLASAESDKEINALEEKLKSEELEPSKRDEIKEEIDRIKGKEKRRLNGIIRFIAELYRHSLLINQIINWCAVELVTRYDKTGDDVYIEYAVGMIEKVGASYEKRKKGNSAMTQDPRTGKNQEEPIEVVLSHLSGIKSNLSNRVRFMIMDLEDLRKNKWVPRHGNTGPKTIEEVHNEVANEQLINQQEREAYEQKKTRESIGGRKGGGGGGGNKSYMGRGSTDNRSFPSNTQTEKRSQAALNSIQTGSLSLKKDMDLKKCEDQQKLGTSRHSMFSRKVPSNESPLTRNSTPPSQSANDTKETSPSTAASTPKASDAD